jgi:multiple sugar transport system substrate-binding protein
MKRKFLTLLLLFFAVTSLGLGCKGLSQSQKQAIQPVTLDFWTVYGDVEQLQTFANEYSQQRGGYVNINIRKIRYDQFDQRLLRALADDVAPDIVSVHSRWLREKRSRLAPMPEQVRVANFRKGSGFTGSKQVNFTTKNLPSNTAIKDNYIQTIPRKVIMDGKAYGLPLAMDTLAVYYNKDLLDAEGIPQPPSSWNELQEAVKATTKYDSSGNITQSGIAMGASNNIGNYFDILSVLMMQNGTTLAQGQQVTFSRGVGQQKQNHPSLQALRFFTDFARENKKVYSWNTDKPSALQSFVRGNSTFYIGYAHEREEIMQRAGQANIEVMALPQLNPSSPANIANYWVQSVTKKSDNKQQAWSFIEYISRPKQVQRYLESTQQPTPIRSQIKPQRQLESMKPFLENILVVRDWYNGRNLEAAQAAFADMIREFKQPIPEKIEPIKRKARILNNSARKVQQTM